MIRICHDIDSLIFNSQLWFTLSWERHPLCLYHYYYDDDYYDWYISWIFHSCIFMTFIDWWCCLFLEISAWRVWQCFCWLTSQNWMSNEFSNLWNCEFLSDNLSENICHNLCNWSPAFTYVFRAVSHRCLLLALLAECEPPPSCVEAGLPLRDNKKPLKFREAQTFPGKFKCYREASQSISLPPNYSSPSSFL